jgi:hypothetical protein
MYRRAARYNKKRSPTDAKPPYIIFNPHSKNGPKSPVQENNDSWIRITSIDPGIKNLGINIKTRYLKSGLIKNNLLARMDLTQTMEIKNGNIYTKDPDSSRIGLDTFHYTNSTNILLEYSDILQSSHYIVIESQLPINYDMTRMGQHLITLLCLLVKDRGNLPILIEIDSKFKGRMMGAKPGIPKRDLKKYCINVAIQISTSRQDYETLNAIKNLKGKADDICDAFCQEEVMFRLLTEGLYRPPLPSTT